MLSLVLIGLIGGLVTGISPCVLPVLPVVFFSGGAAGARAGGETQSGFSGRRPYLVILGLVLSFSVVTLAGALVLSAVHLPEDLLRWIGIVVLTLIGIGLIVPQVQHVLEKPFSRIPQRYVSPERGGLGLGLALGVVFVPCAGPVLAAITVAGATGRVTGDTLLLTLFFAIGTAIPLLVFALAGRRVAERVAAFRRHQRGIRVVAGVVMVGLAVGLVFNLPDALQRLVPDYTGALQSSLAGQKALNGADSGATSGSSACAADATHLVECGTAPALTGIDAWFNTAGDKPITLASLRGKVVLIDFWAYSCINCQRAIPHVEAWQKAYGSKGFEVIGVHSPEYAFEHVESNVKAGAQRLGITYPVALDNEFATWTAYRNEYWPADYLIDAKGKIRHVGFGEGAYDSTESLIRRLLTDANPRVSLPKATDLPDTGPSATTTLTPETYLGGQKMTASSFSGSQTYHTGTFAFPSNVPANTFALSGTWTVADEGITATSSASIRLSYTAAHVYLDVGGTGTLTVTDRSGTRTIDVSGAPDIYDLLKPGSADATSTLTVALTPGLSAYSFTFGSDSTRT